MRMRAVAIHTTLVLTLITIGGLTPSAARFAMREMPIFSTGLVRFSIASILLLLTQRWWMRGDPRAALPIDPRDGRRILICAFLCVPLNQAFYLGGVKMANAAHAGLFYALNPVLVYVFSLLIGLTGWSNRMAIASLVAFAGAAVIFLDGCLSGVCENFLLGDGALLLAVTTWAAYSVLVGPLGQKYGPIRILARIMSIGCLMYLPVLLVDGVEFMPQRMSWKAIGGFAFITLLTSYLNYALWFVAMLRIGVNRLAVALNAAPLLAVPAAHVLLGEPITRWLAFGAALIIGAILLANADRIREVIKTCSAQESESVREK